MKYSRQYDSPLGRITMSSNGRALTGLWFEGQKYAPRTEGFLRRPENLPVFEETGRWLDLYFSGKMPDFAPDLEPEGTPFRQAVWKILLTIPYGETVTYGQIANLLSQDGEFRRASARAVGGAVGHNPISLIIPCHRVIGTDGSLTGYAGGLRRKKYLLAMEAGKTAEVLPQDPAKPEQA